MPVLALLAGLPVLGGLLVLWTISSRDGEEDSRDPLVWAICIAPFAWLIAAVWPLMGNRPFGLEKMPAMPRLSQSWDTNSFARGLLSSIASMMLTYTSMIAAYI